MKKELLVTTLIRDRKQKISLFERYYAAEIKEDQLKELYKNENLKLNKNKRVNSNLITKNLKIINYNNEKIAKPDYPDEEKFKILPVIKLRELSAQRRQKEELLNTKYTKFKFNEVDKDNHKFKEFQILSPKKRIKQKDVPLSVNKRNFFFNIS